MENHVLERDTNGLLVFRYPRDRAPAVKALPDFVPLRLLLRPGTICIEMNESGLVMGRHTTANIRLSLPDVSRQHCRFLFADGLWEVVDLDSLNGVWINGERLQKSVLCQGDILRVASLAFVVELPVPAHQPAFEPASTAAVLQRIADALPVAVPEATQEYRKAC